MQFFASLEPAHVTMIESQPLFFVATAAPKGRINLSPKGYDSFRVLSPTRVAYLDLGGSGNETHAHLAADGRITVMACNFGRPALILRIYGHGRAVLPADEGWEALAEQFTLLPGTRQIFDIAVESVQTSCGYGVPEMTLEQERPTLVRYHRSLEPHAWVEEHAATRSIDGLPVRPPDCYITGNMPE